MMIESVALNKETVVTAGNKLGKDYTAGYICVLFFLAPWLFFPRRYFLEVESDRTSPDQPEWQIHTRRIVTTSVDGNQLRNLWGEISRFMLGSKVPLLQSQGGPLVLNQMDISLAAERSEGKEPLNYLIGRVSSTGEGISGAHAAYNLMVIDEASGSQDAIYEFAQGWAKKFLIFGNPNDTENFFRKMVEEGDIE